MRMKPEKNKKRKKNVPLNAQLYQELERYDEAGVSLWLDGKPSDPESIARACTAREENNYMRDYYSNERNEIYGIGFDKI